MRITSPIAAKIVLTILVALLVGTGSAFADICNSAGTDCTYTLNTVDSTSALGSLASYGTVELRLTTIGGPIELIVSLASGYRLFDKFGFNSSVSPDPSSLTLASTSDALWSPAAASPGSTFDLNPTANNLDGFGNFEYYLNGPSQNANGTNLLDFTVSSSSGFTDVHQLVELSTHGGTAAFFAGHIFNGNGGCAGSCTGWVGATGTAVPEPSSYMWLMGAGFGLIVLVFERRRRKTA